MDERAETSKRLAKAEESIAFAEHTIGELDSVVLDLSRRVESAMARLGSLEARLERLSVNAGDRGAVPGEPAHGTPSARTDDELRAMRPPHSAG